MDWKDLAGTLVKAGAPIIGSALGGPIGGMIGGAIGNVVANALGTEATPEAVNNAITTGDPAVITAQLSAAEAEAQAKWPALAQMAQAEADLGKTQVSEIGETMRAEDNLASFASGWVRNLIAFVQAFWRPYIMMVWGTSLPVQLYWVLTATDVTQRASILYGLAAWNSMPAGIAGVYAWGRTKEKIADMIPPLPGPVGAVANVVKKLVGRK